MFIQEKWHCPKCDKLIANHLERHSCGINYPLSTELAATMIVPQGRGRHDRNVAEEMQELAKMIAAGEKREKNAVRRSFISSPGLAGPLPL